MKNIWIIILLFATTVINGQTIKFAVVGDPLINQVSTTNALEKVLDTLSQKNDINFIVVMGQLTQNGNIEQVNDLKRIIEKYSKQIFVLAGNNDLRDANSWELLKEFSSTKFEFETGDISFIGMGSEIPLSNLKHYTIENLEWLDSILEKIKIGKEYYFFSPGGIINDVNNWQSLVTRFQSKPPQAIISAGANKYLTQNRYGHNFFNIPPFNKLQAANPNYFVFEIGKDTITSKNDSESILSIIDKTINIEKDTVKIPLFNPLDSDIIMKTDLNTTMLTSVIYWNNHIYTSDKSGLITCIDSTGNLLWEFDTNGDIIGQPVIADRMFTAATYQGEIITISAISGEQIQSIGFEDFITSHLEVIEYKGNRELMIPKLTDSKSAIIFGGASGKIYCYDFETLQEYWTNDVAKESIISKPIHINNKILYTSRDGYLYCVDARDGLLIWRWKEKEFTDLSDSQIHSDGKNVFVISTEGYLYAVNLQLGKLEWKSAISSSCNFNMTEDKSEIMAYGKKKSLLIINPSNGKIKKEFKIQDEITNSLDYPVNFEQNIFYSCGGKIFKAGNGGGKNILFMGTAPLHPLKLISNNKYLASNIDGLIVIFSLR